MTTQHSDALESLRRHCEVVAGYKAKDAAGIREWLAQPAPEWCTPEYWAKNTKMMQESLAKLEADERKWQTWAEALGVVHAAI